jgi:RNA polymerase sigma-70 factor (ECF subfamily)
MEAEDAALVNAAQRGDRDAFGQLVARYAPRILGLTTRMLGSAADGEDLAQETFVAAFKALPGFQRGARFSTWLYRIAVNKCTDALRARRPDTISLDAVGDSGVVARKTAAWLTPHGELERAELAGELERRMQALPPLYRESFVLRHIEGLDYDEMSAILGVHRDTLKMRVYKARTLLCRALAGSIEVVR